MAQEAPELIDVPQSRLREFRRELRELLQEAADGKHDKELHSMGISLPSGIKSDSITIKTVTEQPVAAELLVTLAIKYAPLVVPIGTALWAWAWPKLRDRLDGAAKEHKPRE